MSARGNHDNGRQRAAGGWGGPVHGATGTWTPDNATRLVRTDDLNVIRTRTLVYPREIKRDLPMTTTANQTVVTGREAIKNILAGTDPRVLIVVGPCSIHDERAALEYAERLQRLAAEVAEHMCVVMRVYFEKPRTIIGWKGLINDPKLDGSFDIETGIRKARSILLQIAELGLPAGTEMLDPITPQYIADLVTWAAIGARTTESQTHRQMASGLSMPVGFKNGTDGNLQTALDALAAARHAHSFLGIDDNGLTAIVETRGNPWAHLILRGGRSGPNYDPATIAQATHALGLMKLPMRLMVDCSHANANKQYRNQAAVWQSVLAQRASGSTHVIGLMLESNLHEGNQPLDPDPAKLRYGVSITDECIGWEETQWLMREGYKMLTRAQ